jgi:hypothetical protein
MKTTPQRILVIVTSIKEKRERGGTYEPEAHDGIQELVCASDIFVSWKVCSGGPRAI